MLPIRSVRPCGIPGSGEKFVPGIKIRNGLDPEAVHKIKIRAERREGIQRAADESGKDAVMGEPGDPKGEGRRRKAHGDQKEKEDERAQDLGLVFSGSASRGIKGQEDIHGDISVEKTKFLPGDPKICMEPGSFRGIERDLGIMEKTFVVLHGLPVFDHSAEPPCK